MKIFTTLVATLAAVGAFAQQNGITIPTLSGVTVCRPCLITWHGGTPPYILVLLNISFSVLPAGQSNVRLVEFPQQYSTSVTWNVNLGAGTAVSLHLRDSIGAVGQSGIFTILAGTDTSCLTQSLSVSEGPTSTGSGSSSSPSPSSKPGATNSTSTGDPAYSQLNLGAAAFVGAVAFALAA